MTETLDDFVEEEERVTEWMHETLELVRTATEEMSKDNVSSVPAVDIWKLATKL